MAVISASFMGFWNPSNLKTNGEMKKLRFKFHGTCPLRFLTDHICDKFEYPSNLTLSNAESQKSEVQRITKNCKFYFLILVSIKSVIIELDEIASLTIYSPRLISLGLTGM